MRCCRASRRRGAEVERWIDWQATEFNSAWRYAFSAVVRSNPAFHDAREIEASKKQWTRMAGDPRRPARAHRRPMLPAPRFTLADIPIGLSVNRWFMTPFERPSFPGMSRPYYERLSSAARFPQAWPQRDPVDDTDRTAARAVGSSWHRRRACRHAEQRPATSLPLAAAFGDRLAGIVLCVPTRLDPVSFGALPERLLMICGEGGLTAEVTARAEVRLPGSRRAVRAGYDAPGLGRRSRPTAPTRSCGRCRASWASSGPTFRQACLARAFMPASPIASTAAVRP